MITTTNIPRIPKRATVYATGKGGTVFAYGTRFWLTDGKRAVEYSETGAANCINHDPARGGSGNFSVLTCYCHDDTIDRTIYHWGLQIGDETYTTYAQFAAACGAGSELERVLMRGSA